MKQKELLVGIKDAVVNANTSMDDLELVLSRHTHTYLSRVYVLSSSVPPPKGSHEVSSACSLRYVRLW